MPPFMVSSVDRPHPAAPGSRCAGPVAGRVERGRQQVRARVLHGALCTAALGKDSEAGKVTMSRVREQEPKPRPH